VSNSCVNEPFVSCDWRTRFARASIFHTQLEWFILRTCCTIYYFDIERGREGLNFSFNANFITKFKEFNFWWIFKVGENVWALVEWWDHLYSSSNFCLQISPTSCPWANRWSVAGQQMKKMTCKTIIWRNLQWNLFLCNFFHQFLFYRIHEYFRMNEYFLTVDWLWQYCLVKIWCCDVMENESYHSWSLFFGGWNIC